MGKFLVSASLAILLVAASVTSAAQSHWEFVDAKAPRTMEHQLNCQKDLRGIYEDLHIYGVSEECNQRSLLPSHSVYSQLIVLERQALENDTPEKVQEWATAVELAVDNYASHGATVINTESSEGNRYFMSFGKGSRRQQQQQRRFCRLTQVDLPTGQPNYRKVIGSNCEAEELVHLLEALPSNTEILPVRTQGSIQPIVGTLPPDHPIMEKKKSLKHRKALQALVDQVDTETLKQDITWLSGEAEGSPFLSRSSTSKQSAEVAGWLKSQFESYGCDTVELFTYRSMFGPNVICTFKGTEKPDEQVILGAHHDSRGSFLNPRAPGADDDGSGTGMLLQVARIIKQNNIQFKRTFVIAAHSGEEQGLFGSAAYARKLKSQGTNVIMMIQGDMLAYRKPGEPIQTAFPARYHTEELSGLLANVTELYVPETKVGITNACCSDHQSYWESGFPATAFFERNGPIADPMYHNSGDLVNRAGYDFDQLKASVKAMMASVFEIAEVSKGEYAFDD